MFANFCTGREDTKGAIAIAERQAEAHLSLKRTARAAAAQLPPLHFEVGRDVTERSAMTIALSNQATRKRPIARCRRPGSRLKVNRNWLGFWFMLPAAAFLVLFLAYPLGLGIWLSFTDAKIGRAGEFIGLENYEWLWDDSIFWLSVFNTLLYTIVASVIKFAVGLYLALLLNEHMPFKAMSAPLVLIPFIVPTVLSAHRVLVDLRQPVLDHLLVAEEAGADHARTSTFSATPTGRALA